LPGRATAVAASLAALAVLAAGCSSKEDAYKEDFKPLNQRLDAVLDDIDTSVAAAGTKSDEQIEREFGRFARRVGRLREDANELDPPGDFQAAHERLVALMGQAHAALNGIARAAAGGEGGTATDAHQVLVSSAAALRNLSRRLGRAIG
jgi:hypothetical protein